jgi:hypothetical protein
VLGETRRARYPARFGDDPVRGATTAVHRLDDEAIGWSDPDRAGPVEQQR